MYDIPLSSDPAVARAVAGLPHPATVPVQPARSRPRPPGRWVARLGRRRRRPDIGPLLQIPTLAHAEPRQLARMVPHTAYLRMQPGRPLVRAGEIARELIVILSGEAIAHGADGRRVVLGPGTEIGGREALRHERHATTIFATTPVDVVVVNGPSLRWANAVGIARVAPAGPSAAAVAPAAAPDPAGHVIPVAPVAQPAG